MLGAVPIIIDPIFSGLAWSLIFGLFASTLFTLFVIPVVYWLLYANKPGHGLPQSAFGAEKANVKGAGGSRTLTQTGTSRHVKPSHWWSVTVTRVDRPSSRCCICSATSRTFRQNVLVFHKARLNLMGYGTFLYRPPGPH